MRCTERRSARTGEVARRYALVMSARPPVRGILLDFYGTVVDDDDVSIAKICDAVADTHGSIASSQVGSLWSREFSAATAVAHGSRFLPQRAIAEASLSAVLTTIGSPLSAETLCAPQLAFWREPRLRPGSREFLQGCRLPICVVSNIDSADLDEAITRHGLDLPHRVTSEETRSYKPRPEMFLAALDLLGLGAEDVLHVGDSLSSDVAGAGQLGIRAAWVNSRNRVAPADPLREFEINELRELLPALSQAPQSAPRQPNGIS